MNIQPFKLERYFAQYEFDVPHLLSSSDSEPLTLPQLLAYASDERRHQWENLWLGYTESQGNPELLALVAGLYDGMTIDNIIGVVPEEGIFIAMNTLLQAGDHLICTAPGYQSLYEIGRANGCEVSLWYPDAEQGWHFNVDVLADLIQPNTRMIAVNFPHNPTGALPTQAAFNRIVELARQHNIILFSDEMYRFFEYDPVDRLPAACEVYENAVSLCGLSKSFGLPGLRIGWLATQNTDYMAQFQVLKDYTTICGSAPSEMLAIIALENQQQLAARNLEITLANLRELDDFFARWHNLLWWQRPKAGTITFAKFTRPVKDVILYQDIVDKSGVMVLPSTVYDYEGSYFRLGFGRRSFPKALAAFEGYLEAHF